MARLSADNYVRVDSEKIDNAINKTGMSKGKISAFVLKRDGSSISKALSRGSFDKNDLKVLCEFLDIDYNSVIVNSTEVPTVKTNNVKDTSLVPQLETLICGSNLMYENQKKMIEIMENMLVEIKALGTRQNRLENAMAQIVQNGAILKDNANKINDGISNARSTLNLISGRLKDISNDVQRKGKVININEQSKAN